MAMAEAKDDASSNGAGEEDATGTPVFGIVDDDDAEGSDQKNHKADNEEVESAQDKEEEDADTKELLLKKADDCLYKGKAEGRNKVLAAEPL